MRGLIGRRAVRALLLLALAGGLTTVAGAARTLDIYFIDVEGGQATLVVAPGGQSLLIDAGFAGAGAFDSVPGDPHAARDANRIVAAAHAAGVRAIDMLLVTHFHADHDGGIPELAALMPIHTFIDHDRPSAIAAQNPGIAAAFARYEAVRAHGVHVIAHPGDRYHLPSSSLEITVVSSAGATLSRPLAGAGEANQTCGAKAMPPDDAEENARSTGVVVQYGRFRFFDVGDLSGDPLFALVCPRNMVGAVDVFSSAHHGDADTADPAVFAALRPRVVVVDNAADKGGASPFLTGLANQAGLDGWQLHRVANAPNAPDARLANLDDSTSAWIRVSADESGAFTVTNARTGSTIRYARRR